jgi:ABC-type uncharacterized transport system substrate-binding protein
MENALVTRRRLLTRTASLAVSTSAFALLAGCEVARSVQQRSARIGFLASNPVPPTRLEAFRAALHDLGWVEGHNLVIEERYAHGQDDQLPGLAAELGRLPVHVIVAPGGPSTTAACRATQSIPVVTTTGGDGVLTEGWAASFAHPGGNVTGFTVTVSGPGTSSLDTKRVELLAQVAPGRQRLAVIGNSLTSDTEVARARVDSTAGVLGIQTDWYDVHTDDELATTTGRITSSNAQLLTVLPDVFLIGRRPAIVELALRRDLPAVYAAREWVDDGGLMSYGPSQVALYRRAADYVDRILRGARAGDLPIEQPSTFELALNARTAQAHNITVPPDVVAQITDWVR